MKSDILCSDANPETQTLGINSDGTTWHHILTEKGLDDEGDFGGLPEFDSLKFFSLRDTQNTRLCTIVYETAQNRVISVTGTNRKIPEAQYENIREFINGLNCDLFFHPLKIECLYVGINGTRKTLIDRRDFLARIQTGDIVYGAVDMSDFQGDIHLPSELTIHGSLFLIRCPHLTEIHSKLTASEIFVNLNESLTEMSGEIISEVLDLSDCSNLLTLRCSMEKGRLILDRCFNLKELPKHLRHVEVSLVGCAAITRLDDDFTAEALAIDEMTGIVELPPFLKVQSMRVSGCPWITRIPAGPYKTLMIYHCENLEALPQNMTVSEFLSLDYCQSFKHLPEEGYVEILSVNNCRSLREIPPGLKIQSTLLLKTDDASIKLPHVMDVSGTIMLSGLSNLELPPYISCDDLLVLECPNIDSIPPNIHCNILHIQNCAKLDYITSRFGEIFKSDDIPALLEQKSGMSYQLDR